MNQLEERIKELGAYSIEKVKELPEVNGTGYIIRHDKTKARVCVISNDDENKVFFVGFRTPASNSKGIQHIVEHTVLCGSEKYPAKDPFIELAKGSLNTFLNAMTFSDKTIYPIASCNHKDYANLMDVYLDAVFNPNIYAKEEIFKQEGWHYELEDADSDLIINGVVYNEMRGAYSNPDNLLATEINKVLFPDTCYKNDSGGDPEVIPSLTREEYLDYHKNYYHPSNSYIYLYGDMDVIDRLKYLDEEYLSKYDYLYVPSEIEVQAPFAEPVKKSINYPIADGESKEGKNILTYNIVIGESTDVDLISTINILIYLLCEVPGAPLKEALVDAGICADIEAMYDSSLHQPVLSIIARDSSEADTDRFVQIINDEFRKYADGGIDKDALLAAINFFEFKAREIKGGRYPRGLDKGITSLEAWLHDDLLALEAFEELPLYKNLRENVDTGFIEDIIRKNFLENTFKAYVIMTPEYNLNKELDDKLAADLAAYKASLSDEEIKKLIEDTKHLKEYQSEPSTQEELEKIPLLTIDDLEKHPRKLVNDITEDDGVKLVEHKLFANGISYVSLLFDFSDIPFEDLKYVSILNELYGYVDTENFKYDDLSTEINIHTGGVSLASTCIEGKDANDLLMQQIVKFKCFDDKFDDAFRIVDEMIHTSKIINKKKVKEIIAEIVVAGRQSFLANGHMVAVYRALSYIHKASMVSEAMGGIDYQDFVTELLDNFDERWDELSAKLLEVQEYLFRKDNLIVSYTGEVFNEKFKASFAEFRKTLSDKKVSKDKTIVPLKIKNEGLKAATKVQYVAKVSNFKAAGLKFDGSMDVLTTILSYDYLWNNVRVLGGAYGSMCAFTRTGNEFFTSYRDPKLMETYEVYRQSTDYVEGFECSDRDMLKYIIGTIAKSTAPMSPEQYGSYSMRCYLTGLEYDELQRIRDEVLSTDQAKIRSLVPYIKVLADSQVYCAIGDENKIEEAKDNFKEIRKLV